MFRLNVPDMTCGHCVGAVTKAVKSVDPGAEVAIDLDSKTASIESQVVADRFVAAIAEAGYGATVKKSCCGHGA